MLHMRTVLYTGELLCAGVNVMGFDWIASPACTELEVITLDWYASHPHTTHARA